MKKYHEVATIRKENEIVDYLISFSEASLKGKTSDWGCIDSEIFENMVKSGQVQYLEFKDGKIVCEYTEEEKDYLRKITNIGNKKSSEEYISAAQKHYFDMDVQFKAEHAEATAFDNCIAACVGDSITFFGITMVSVVFYCRNQVTMQKFLDTVKQRSFATVSYFNRMGAGMSIPIKALQMNKEILDEFNILWNTATCRFVTNNSIGINNFFMKQAVPKEMIQICDILDQQTLETERKIGIR